MASSFHVNQRLSLDGSLSTIRYIGSVEGTKGEWLGVEWDDVIRGKHNGIHNGHKYFKCKSSFAADIPFNH
jgi:dynactin complex subunit